MHWAKKTGWVFVTLAGGPSPRRGGDIEVGSYEVRVVGRKKFAEAYTDFAPMVMAPFLTFARSIFGLWFLLLMPSLLLMIVSTDSDIRKQRAICFSEEAPSTGEPQASGSGGGPVNSRNIIANKSKSHRQRKRVDSDADDSDAPTEPELFDDTPVPSCTSSPLPDIPIDRSNPFLLEREANIARNRAAMIELGILDAQEELQETLEKSKSKKGKERVETAAHKPRRLRVTRAAARAGRTAAAETRPEDDGKQDPDSIATSLPSTSTTRPTTPPTPLMTPRTRSTTPPIPLHASATPPAPSTKLPTPPTQLSEPSVPPLPSAESTPAWFEPALAFFKGLDLGSQWEDLVSAWVEFEVSVAYGEGESGSKFSTGVSVNSIRCSRRSDSPNFRKKAWGAWIDPLKLGGGLHAIADSHYSQQSMTSACMASLGAAGGSASSQAGEHKVPSRMGFQKATSTREKVGNACRSQDLMG
jgi:hypothetical protein